MITNQFVTEGDIESAIIRKATWGVVSHVDTVLPPGLLLPNGAHTEGGELLGARNSANGAPTAGVQIRKPNYAKFTTIIRASVQLTPEQEARYYSFLFAQIGKPYDIDAIVNFAFHRDWRMGNKWFCSELKTATFEHAGRPMLNPMVPAYHITPQGLLMSPDWDAVQILLGGSES